MHFKYVVPIEIIKSDIFLFLMTYDALMDY